MLPPFLVVSGGLSCSKSLDWFYKKTGLRDDFRFFSSKSILLYCSVYFLLKSSTWTTFIPSIFQTNNAGVGFSLLEWFTVHIHVLLCLIGYFVHFCFLFIFILYTGCPVYHCKPLEVSNRDWSQIRNKKN